METIFETNRKLENQNIPPKNVSDNHLTDKHEQGHKDKQILRQTKIGKS